MEKKLSYNLEIKNELIEQYKQTIHDLLEEKKKLENTKRS